MLGRGSYLAVAPLVPEKKTTTDEEIFTIDGRGCSLTIRC